MTCNTNIIDCLKGKGVNPIAYAKSESGVYKASVAIDYESTVPVYHSLQQNEPQWWYVDLKQTISIDKYQINTGTGCAYLKEWNASVSTNNRTWTRVDAQESYPQNKIIALLNPVNARFFKIDGKNSDCSGSPNYIAFKYIKFYGSLSPIHNKKEGCSCRKEMKLNYLYFVSFLLST